MKAQLVDRSAYQDSSFELENHSYKNFLKVWHYHPEPELVIIRESRGTRFVGDNIDKFEPGEIVLLGKNLPHQWLNDKVYFEKHSNLRAKAHVIHFHENFMAGILKIPEMREVSNLFEKAKRGIKFEGTSNNLVITLVDEMFELHGYDRTIHLLKVLKYLSRQSQYKMLSSTGYIHSFKKKKSSKILRIYEYIMNNFTNGVCLEQAAELANMNASAFSRYFKRIQKKTFTQFVNEVKIGYACKLLIEQKCNISEVCYKSGFNNISNFNRQFKSLKKMTPTEFIEKHAGI